MRPRLRAFWLLALRPLGERASRTALTIFGVAFGVALYVAIAVVNDATTTHFTDAMSSLAGGATVSIRGGSDGFPEETLDRVEAVDGVDRVVPLVIAQARVPLGDAEHGLVVLGIDMLREGAVRSYGDASIVDDPLEVLNQADSVVIPTPLAREKSLSVGSAIVLVTTNGPKTFTVRGILPELRESGAAKAFGGRVVFMDIDAARVSFAKEGKTDRLDIVAKKGTDVALLERSLGTALPALRVERPSAEIEAFRRMVRSYQAVLADLSRLALVVAAFLVASTLGVIVAERRQEIGIVRAIGASRRLVLFSFLAQAAVVGIVGAVFGVVLGWLFARLLVATVSHSVALHWATPIEGASLVMTSRHLVLALGAGVLSSIAGGFFPALRASSVACVEALRPKGVEAEPRDRPAIVFGLALLVLVAIGPSFLKEASLSMGFVGSALIAPAIARALLRFFTLLGRARITRFLPPLRLALSATSGSAQRATGSAMLALALILVVLVASAHATLRDALTSTTSRMLAADVWVSESGALFTGQSLPLPNDLRDTIDRTSGLAGKARAMRAVRILHEGSPVLVKAWDPVDTKRSPIVALDGDEQSIFAASERPSILLSESFATRVGKKRGDVIDLETPSGRTAFVVTGLVLDFVPEGSIAMNRATYTQYWKDTTVTAFFVDAAPGVAPKEARDRIERSLGHRQDIVVRVNEDVRKHALDLLDEGFAYTRAIEGAALLVSLLGLASTVLVSLLERKRELGVLRAIGMSRGALAQMIVVEMATLGLAASITALVLGSFHARFWLGGVLAQEVGWPLVVNVPLEAVVFTVGAGVLAGIFAGLFGAERASTSDVCEALSSS